MISLVILRIFSSQKKIAEIFSDNFYLEGEVGRDNKQKLELAKKMAEKINARKGDGKQSESQATAEAVMKGLAVKPAAAPTVSNKLLADQIAAKLNAKLGHVPMDRNETEQQAQVRNHKYFFQNFMIFVLETVLLKISISEFGRNVSNAIRGRIRNK